MNKPLVTCLSFSGGKQSTGLLWMMLKGYIPVDPDYTLILNANPGMEDSRTMPHVDEMLYLACKAGFTAMTVEGPNLYEDIINLPGSKKTRLDNPPYWVDRPAIDRFEYQLSFDDWPRPALDTNPGRLRHKCTWYYKIAPMDRALRVFLEEQCGISQKTTYIPHGCVEKWIGFGINEVERIKPSQQKYIRFRYPLIEKKVDIVRFFEEIGKPLPPRSVCNACFANGLNHYRDMCHNRHDDWSQAVTIDDAVRDWTQIGVKYPVYVSKTLMSLRELAENDFRLSGRENVEQEFSCDSGYCFL